MKRFFHGTRRKLPVGVELQARTKEGNQFEKLIEYFRPPNANSRLASFFLADNIEEVEYLGPAQRYIYEVVPNVKPTKVSFGWLDGLPGCSYATGRCKESVVRAYWSDVEGAIGDYWKGRRSPYGFEYLTPNITVKRLVGYGILK